MFLRFKALLHACVFGHMTTIIQQLTTDASNYREMMKTLKEFVKLNFVPNWLSKRMVEHVAAKWSIEKGAGSLNVRKKSFKPKKFGGKEKNQILFQIKF